MPNKTKAKQQTKSEFRPSSVHHNGIVTSNIKYIQADRYDKLLGDMYDDLDAKNLYSYLEIFSFFLMGTGFSSVVSWFLDNDVSKETIESFWVDNSIWLILLLSGIVIFLIISAIRHFSRSTTRQKFIDKYNDAEGFQLIGTNLNVGVTAMPEKVEEA